MLMERLILIGLCAGGLAACGSTPTRVRMPDVEKSAEGEQRYIVAYERDAEGKLTRPKTLAEDRNQRLPIEYTRSGLLAQLEAHEHVWSSEAGALARNKEGLGNLQFGGAVLGALGVIGKSLDVGRAGAAIAGGAGVWDGHYQLAVQKNNYRRGSEATRCARLKVEAIPPAFFTAYYYQSRDKAGMLRFSKDLLTGNGVDEAGYERLNTLFPTVNRSLQEIRDRLQVAQETVTLSTPSTTDIVNAIQQKADESDENKERADKMVSGVTNRVELVLRRRMDIARRLEPGDFSGATAKQVQELTDLVEQLIESRGKSLDDLPIDHPAALQAAAAINRATVKMALDLQNELATCVAILAK